MKKIKLKNQFVTKQDNRRIQKPNNYNLTILKTKKMKILLNSFLESLNQSEVKILTTEVKETLALNFKNEKNKIFSSAELWNIHRRRKNISARKFYF